jgi:IS30 family transposase
LKAGESQAAISRALGFDTSTISRALRHNSGQRGYRAKQAHRRCQARRAGLRRKRISRPQWRIVEAGLRQDWSAEQIYGVMLLKELMPVSHERIYQHVYADKRRGGTLHKHLRCQKQRRKRRGVFNRRGLKRFAKNLNHRFSRNAVPRAIVACVPPLADASCQRRNASIKGRVWISERPDIVEIRARIGDWKVDTVVGHKEKAALFTLTDRKSRLCRAVKVHDRTADTACKAIRKTLSSLRAQVHTLTYDNGPEFSYHQAINRALGSKSDFAHPYHSRERGTNENMNGLLRQDVPKGRSMAKLTQAHVHAAIERMNKRPRKCLGYKTPNQVFRDETQTVALET